MLAVILTILKVIGIIILVLLGVLLLLLVGVLFVPVRYRIRAQKQDEILVKVNLLWFLHFVYVTVKYEQSKWLFIIRLLGIPIYDSRRPKKESKKGKKETIKRKTKNKKITNKKITNKKNANDDTTSIDVVQVKDRVKDKDTVQNHQKNEDSSFVIEEKLEKNSDTQGMKCRIQQIINIILSIPNKIKNTAKSIKNGIYQTIEFIKKIVSFPNTIKEFIYDEDGKTALGIIYQTIRDLLKHSTPKRITGEIIFGFDDPCTTGQVLGVISVVYAYIAPRKIRVIPDFQETRLEGHIDANGKVRGFTALRLILKLLRDEHFKNFKGRIDQFKEENNGRE